jgi:hypothetical protein
VNIALAIVIVAVSVAPVYAAGNMASWLSSLGLNSPANWLIAHAQHSVHLSTGAISHLVSKPCVAPCVATTSEFGIDVSDVALYASGALLVCSVVLLLLPIMRRLIHAHRSDAIHGNMHAHG